MMQPAPPFSLPSLSHHHAGGNHFPFAVYSLPLTLAMRAGYWDPATIPEDWHMCIRIHFHTSQHVRCRTLFLATGSDCVATENWFESIKEAYYQSVRWSYGAVDYGYVLASIFSHWNVGAFRKLRLFLRAFEVHVLMPLMLMALACAPIYARYEVSARGGEERGQEREERSVEASSITLTHNSPHSFFPLVQVRLTVPAWMDPTYVPRNVIGAPPPPARQLSVSFGQLQAALGLPTIIIHWFLVCVFGACTCVVTEVAVVPLPPPLFSLPLFPSALSLSLPARICSPSVTSSSTSSSFSLLLPPCTQTTSTESSSARIASTSTATRTGSHRSAGSRCGPLQSQTCCSSSSPPRKRI